LSAGEKEDGLETTRKKQVRELKKMNRKERIKLMKSRRKDEREDDIGNGSTRKGGNREATMVDCEKEERETESGSPIKAKATTERPGITWERFDHLGLFPYTTGIAVRP
jgi:hypothetical protein